MVRRVFLGGELGGTNKVANVASSTIYVCLWLAYIGMFAYFEKNPIFNVVGGVTSCSA